ncbi:MAG: hypothetical protein IKP31_07230, partial [Lachnospiraceae bacterium]|nr:hypothetical protein [Lachnospiraceae bacterium]
NKDSRYIWKNDDRKDRYTIEGIETPKISAQGGETMGPETQAPEAAQDITDDSSAEGEEVYINSQKTAMSVCLDELLKTDGIYVDTVALLAEGQTPLDIMKENMADGVPLALSGCSTDAMLYYVSNDIPVMAMVEDDMVVLITGYDENTLVIYNPLEGKLLKNGMKDLSGWFASNGNRFLTYAK